MFTGTVTTLLKNQLEVTISVSLNLKYHHMTKVSSRDITGWDVAADKTTFKSASNPPKQ